MKLLIVISLVLFYASSKAQCTLTWVGNGHPQYFIQSSPDASVWNYFATVPGTADSNYTYKVGSSTSYYRIYADKDTSNSVFVGTVLKIHGHKRRIMTEEKPSFNINIYGDQIIIESDIPQKIKCSIYNTLWQKISEQIYSVATGKNIERINTNQKGVLTFSFETDFDKVITKQIIR